MQRVSSTKPLRIAMVAACPFPSLRGSQVLIRELSEELAAAGHLVHIVTYPIAQHPRPVKRIVIHRLARIPGLWTVHPLGWQKLLLDCFLVFLLCRVVRREHIDVIHAHNVEGGLIAVVARWWLGVPVVYHAHNALTDELPRYFRSAAAKRGAYWLGRMFDENIARGADRAIALSDRLGAFLAMRGFAGRVHVIPPGVRGIKADGARELAWCGRSRRGAVLMYAGNLDPYQDIAVLVEAFARVREQEPSARLVFVVHPPAHESVRRMSRALAGQPAVAVIEVRTARAMAAVLSTADVVVCPRGSWSGFPIKVLNYMALARPVLHARGSAHAVEDGVTGVIFEDGNPAALADGALRMLRNPTFAERLGEQARAAVWARYGWGSILPRVVGVYMQLMRERRKIGHERGLEAREPRMTRTRRNQLRVTLRRSGARRVRALAVLFGLVSVLGGGCAGRRDPVASLPPIAAPSLVEFSENYRLLPGDILRVHYTYHPELNTRVQLHPDGTISLDEAGVIVAQGKTTSEVAREIEKLSAEYLRDPAVTVVLAELGPHKVYVGGEVREPGIVQYREGMTPLQAILARGGFTDVARADSVLKLSVGPDGQPRATRLNFSGTINEGSPEIAALAVHDVLYVPRTFIGDANTFVRLYIRNMLPVPVRAGFGFAP